MNSPTIPDDMATEPTALCKRLAPLLALVRTDAISPEQDARVREHLAGCAGCRRALAAYDALDADARRWFGSAAARTAPITLAQVMRAAEPAAGAAPHASRVGRTLPTRGPRLSALATLAAVLVVGVFSGLIVTRHFAGTPVGSGPVNTTPMATATATVTGPSATLIGPTWRLTEFVVNGVDQPLVAGHAPTLHFYAHGVAGGNGGCNGYGTNYAVAGDALTIGGLGYTQMYCQASAGDATVMDQESAYFKAVPRVWTYRLGGEMLILTSGDGRVRLTFHAS